MGLNDSSTITFFRSNVYFGMRPRIPKYVNILSIRVTTVHSIQISVAVCRLLSRIFSQNSILRSCPLVVSRSLLSGLMWFVYDGQFNIRHTCEHGDHLQRFGWVRHDGTSFGQQEIIDNGQWGCGLFSCGQGFSTLAI